MNKRNLSMKKAWLLPVLLALPFAVLLAVVGMLGGDMLMRALNILIRSVVIG